MERARHKLLTELLDLDVPRTARGAALSTALDERAAQTRARLAELQADGAVPSVDEADGASDGAQHDALERAGQSLGALRLLTELRRRDLDLELSRLRMQRQAALRAALVCRKRLIASDCV